MGRSSGEMPWHIKEEFQHFKNTTIGFPLIMGRKTFESLGNKPLKGRLNIILTHSKHNYNNAEVKVFENITDAYQVCEEQEFEKCFVIGGGSIFEQEINSVDEMILSWLDMDAEGDIYFPKIDDNLWYIDSREKRSVFEIVHYKKKL